ncbi:MAG: glycosyltransferase family 4 protein [Nitrosopumilaceae archaeon]
MKLLFISPRYAGGIGGHAAMLASKLRDYGFDVEMMHVPHIPIKNLKNPSFAVLSTLKGMLSKRHYDIIHAFNLPSAFAMRFAKGKKKVLSIHGIYSEQVKALHSSTVSTMANTTESKILKWPDKLTTDSKATQKAYKEKLGLDFEYLPSPLDINKFSQIPDVKKIEKQVVYVGRDSYEKGIDILRNIESQINGKVVYCTNVSWEDAMTTMKASSVVVVPSRIESLPTTVKEAFYLHVPVVGTNVGGIPELITNEVTGLLVPPNDPTNLGNAINQLLENKEFSKKLADAAFDFVIKNMTWDVVLPKYIKFYEEVLN